MNTSSLKSYAPQARRDFIAAVTERAVLFGLTKETTQPVTSHGDVVIIDGKAYSKTVGAKRKRLEERIERQGFDQVMEAMAYTWFNRLMAIRYMELHGYLEHGYRVLSGREGRGVRGEGLGARPEVLEHATEVDLPGLDRDWVIECKLDGTRDEELYRELLLAQCHALHEAMPFLFEEIGDETELLLPTGLLHTESLIRQLVEQVDEDLWQEIEIIGWLYQFYISEKKDQVIGKVVKSEDIPAATQLFTPNWIVKYMVQNSLGAQWLATYPDSPLKDQMEYYIEPAEQTEAVNEELARVQREWLEQKAVEYREEWLVASDQWLDGSPILDHYSLSPEHLTLMDPACGSGHILVEAYELFKAIYLERGYRQRDVPELILEKNLFGLDIDERAAQLTGFALVMKGRADDRRLFERGVKLNVMALRDSGGRKQWQAVTEQLAQLATGHSPLPTSGKAASPLATSHYPLSTEINGLVDLFEHATTFGSLIQVPEQLAEKLPALKQLSEATSQDLFVSDTLKRLGPLVQQAELLAAQYDAVVANPPYMGSGGMNAVLKKFAKEHFPDAKSDLFACFIERGYTLAKDVGHNAMVTMQVWMFISSFQKMRERMLREKTIQTMAHLGARAFGSISGEVVQTTSLVLKNLPMQGYKPVFFRLLEGGECEKRTTLASGRKRFDTTNQDEFKKIPGSPLAYWLSAALFSCFDMQKVGDFAEGEGKNVTADNNRFLRNNWEVSAESVGRGRKWLPYSKGGPFRKWSGNLEFVIDWRSEARLFYSKNHSSRIIDEKFWYRPGITWTDITSSGTGFRYLPRNTTYDTTGISFFLKDDKGLIEFLSAMNSKPCLQLVQVINPTLHANLIDVKALPIPKLTGLNEPAGRRCIEISDADWDAYERSWNFAELPLLSGQWLVDSGQKKTRSQSGHARPPTSEPIHSQPESTSLAAEDNLSTVHCSLATSYTRWVEHNRKTIAEMKRLEEENNRLFIDAYGLADELTPDVPLSQITLTVNPAYRYGKKVASGQWSVASGFGEELEGRFREDTMKELISYAIGCMMGRYRLDRPGLIYAHSGNERFWEIWEGEEEEVASGQWPVASGDEERGKAASSLDPSHCSPTTGGKAASPLATSHYSLTTGGAAAPPLATSHYSLTTKFHPDEDGIVPLTDTEWFEDDACHRLVEFISVAWDKTHLEDNLTFLANNLKPRKNESSRETLRRWLCDKFFKDHHLKGYKKRPIYWLFSSGKLKAFQCLVYLHRYHEGTLGRMRTEYVIPLQGLMASRLDRLKKDIEQASSTSHKKKLEKERQKLSKQRIELQEFDEKLRHFADQRIHLDLDDGVKVNYGKFGDLLAEVK